MKLRKTIKLCSLSLAIAALSAAPLLRAELQPGSKLQPYEIHNTETGKEYCQMCAYSSKPATVAAYGSLNDPKFWSDLKQLEVLQQAHPKAGFFAQILDSDDAKAIQAKAKENGITFPIVYAKDKDWNNVYKVDNVSRTIYLSHNFKIEWSTVGLDTQKIADIQKALAQT